MSKKLYIAEKPSLAKTIANHLGGGSARKGFIEGSGWTVTWCIGHLYRLYKPEEYDEKYKSWSDVSTLPIIPSTWKYKVDGDKKDQAELINALISKAESVIHVGDPDNEGQFLVDLVIRKSGFSGPVYRLWPDDLSPTGLKKCFSKIKPNDEYRGNSLAAEYRGKADWLIGINFTRLFTLIARKSGYRDVVSLGRVQSPTHALIVNRCREISNFKTTYHFGVKAACKSNGVGFDANWVIPDDLKDPNGYLLDKAEAEKIVLKVTGKPGTVENIKSEEKANSAPLPFNLTKLQSYANSKWKLTAMETLEVAQKLYDNGYLTYPRSDCNFLSEGDFVFAEPILKNIAALETLSPVAGSFGLAKKPKCYNDSKTTAHTAIVPTTKMPDIDKLSPRERDIYIAVCERFAMQFMPAHRYLSSTIDILIEAVPFRARSKSIIENGWKLLDSSKSDTVEDSDESTADLSSLSKGGLVNVVKCDIANKKTNPPKYFNEGSLLEAMGNIANFVDNPDIKKRLKESDGIGTEATRAHIIHRLKQVNYDSLKSNGDIIATKIGYKVFDAFPDALKDPSMTALWEAALKRIEKGVADHNSFLEQQSQWLRVQISSINDNLPKLELKEPSKYKCNVCGSPMNRVKGKFGHFWSCAGYPDECKNTLQDINGKPLYPLEGDGEKCTSCETGVMKTKLARPKGKPVKAFLGCNNHPKCNNAIWPK